MYPDYYAKENNKWAALETMASKVFIKNRLALKIKLVYYFLIDSEQTIQFLISVTNVFKYEIRGNQKDLEQDLQKIQTYKDKARSLNSTLYKLIFESN